MTAVATASAKPVEEPKRVTRTEFNRLAMAINRPIFWREDTNKNGTLDPDELEVWGLSAARKAYVDGGKFTDAYREALKLIDSEFADENSRMLAILAPESGEGKRIALVKKDLAQGRQTLVRTDVSALSEDQKTFVKHVTAAARMIENLYAAQMGVAGLQPAQDSASAALFWRNQGPKCSGPVTEKNPECHSTLVAPAIKLSGLYPVDAMVSGATGCGVHADGKVECAGGATPAPEPKFCEKLDKKLMDPFTVVRGVGKELKSVPYTEVYADGMKQVSAELKAAASDLKDPTEGALRTYLLAASKAFTDNNWWPADEAWAKMGVNNSKFYLRVAPDEVYAEPCSTKALFHVSFGLINKGSLRWQGLLDPRKTAMENVLAKLAGEPYKARNVSFKLPDFVDIAINAGDSRAPSGVTIGQSLPNFGPVANQGRGRTVAMTNFYNDPDSLEASQKVAESLFCKDTMQVFTTDPEPQLMSTVLHEAAHNLGPAHQYKVKGKTDREVFGGPLGSTLEELKAQTAAEYFTDWLVTEKVIDQGFANKAHVRDLFWAFGHISRGMYDEDKHPKNYSQLAAIQFGSLVRDGAVAFRADETAANGADAGCYSADLSKFPASFEAQMKVAAGIKARGDKALAETLIRTFVDAGGETAAHLQRIQTRVLRSPKASFVYSIRTE